ncbi:MAG: hypothetical protein ACXACC_06710 [Promethearchaeota archaeon]|jgi:hypothetical protein
MVRYYLKILKIINALIFVWLILVFLSIFSFNEVLFTSDGEFALFSFIDSIKNIFTLIIFAGAYIIALGCAFIATTVFLPFINRDFMFSFIDGFFKNFLNLWFTFPDGTTPDLNQIPDLILNEISIFFGDFYLILFQLLFVISIIYAIRTFLKTNPKHDLIAVGALVLMIIVPLIFSGFNELLDLFHVSIEYLEDLPNPLDPSLNSIPIDNFFLFLASPVILLAIISYLYIELAFQINYTETVTRPSLERSDRLEIQLEILKSESHYITANVEKIKEEAKSRMKELEIGEKTTISKFFAKTSEKFSYIKEMIEKRKLEEEEKKLVTAASKTRRLGRYVERLYREDIEAQDTLTARSSAPRAQSLALSTFLNILIRLVVLIIISFIIIHPKWFLEDVFNLPPAITESVVMFSPEIILLLLLPIMLIFPIVSKIVSFIKHRNLIIRLQQEGRIKEILTSVGDYVKKEEIKEKEAKEEVKAEEAVT